MKCTTGTHKEGEDSTRESARKKEKVDICALLVINDRMLLYIRDRGQPYLDCDDVARFLESDLKDLTTSSTANLALADQV